MATIDDFTNGSKRKWQLRGCLAARRYLFWNTDYLILTKHSANQARLDAKTDTGATILGRGIVLTLNGAALEATDYGRTMRLELNLQDSKNPVLIYSADYQEGPVGQPDEGGEGDPK